MLFINSAEVMDKPGNKPKDGSTYGYKTIEEKNAAQTRVSKAKTKALDAEAEAKALEESPGRLPNGLTHKQERFCQEYPIDLVGTHAAIRAGYSSKSAGAIAFDLLKHPKIITRLQEVQLEIGERTELNQDFVLNKLKNYSMAKITDYFDIKGRGKKKILVLKDLKKLPPEYVDAIQEISQLKDGAIRIKLVDKKGSAVDIGRHLGMFQDNFVVTPLSFEALMLAKQKEDKARAARESVN